MQGASGSSRPAGAGQPAARRVLAGEACKKNRRKISNIRIDFQPVEEARLPGQHGDVGREPRMNFHASRRFSVEFRGGQQGPS